MRRNWALDDASLVVSCPRCLTRAVCRRASSYLQLCRRVAQRAAAAGGCAFFCVKSCGRSKSPSREGKPVPACPTAAAAACQAQSAPAWPRRALAAECSGRQDGVRLVLSILPHGVQGPPHRSASRCLPGHPFALLFLLHSRAVALLSPSPSPVAGCLSLSPSPPADIAVASYLHLSRALATHRATHCRNHLFVSK